MSAGFKWALAVVVGILGLLGVAVAVVYMSVMIGNLPSYVPGRMSVAGHHFDYGHYHKRAAIAGGIGVVLLIASVLMAVSARRRTRRL